MPSVYIASSLENAEQVRAVRDTLAALGAGLTYDWTEHGSVQDEGPERIAEVARAELRGIYEARLVVVLLPGGRGTHTELGYALGLGKPVLLFGPLDNGSGEGRHCAFYYARGVLRMGDQEVVGVLRGEQQLAPWSAKRIAEVVWRSMLR